MAFVHGGNIIATASSLGLRVDELIDMSSNLSPLGMVPGLREVLEKGISEIAYLPEATSSSLCALFADHYGCKPQQVMAGNGTTDFIYDLPALGRFKKAVIVNPTYSDYSLACEYAGLPWQSFTLEFPDFAINFAALSDTLEGGELLFLCNPNNPTGHMVDIHDLRTFINNHPQTTFVIDESYLPFTGEASLVSGELPDNLFILCSSSKIYGIPGLRLGFVVSSKKNMAIMMERCRPWCVNRLAQIAGEFLLAHGDFYVRDVQAFMASTRPSFVAELHAMPGLVVVAGVANFILCRLTAMTANELAEKMLAEKIMIRNCASFDGLDDSYFRISLKNGRDNRLFLDAMAAVFK
ncbi:MAG: aminotransferase class I/II-fold pyridoxal phosphate-dependent enzyme [Proteobacteria bacterium]|nr:aminotransferase class I/II-fold pyridoxal phosphate-dependent enzyme [Pseudomonadota bacterium]MBU1639575.1 aminotransferase class I/II-fold pyridoxal phosphate-dependent enzyme [Pseudomonadota bacterium]